VQTFFSHHLNLSIQAQEGRKAREGGNKTAEANRFSHPENTKR
jgi:hypothetical protein